MNKVLKKTIMGTALVCMAVSCGQGESYEYEDLQEGVQREYRISYGWALLPFCHFDETRIPSLVITLRDGNKVKIGEGKYHDKEYAPALTAAVEAKDYKKADYIFSLLKGFAMANEYHMRDAYNTCLSVYLKCKVTALLEEGSLEAKDQILSFLNNYETIDEADEKEINKLCDDVFGRALRSGDRSLAERMVRCYRQDEETLKNGKTVKTWTSKNAAKKQLQDAIKSGEL